MKLRRVTADWLPAEPFYAKLERNGLGVTALDVPGEHADPPRPWD